MRVVAALLLGVLITLPLPAQKQKREPLTEAQQDQIAEAGIDPVARVNLYVKFLDAYFGAVNGLIKRAKSPARTHRLNDELEDFSALMDELGDNLDVYSERKADIRRSLKGLNEAIGRWQGVLHDLPSEPGFEISLKEALDSASDLAGQTKQIAADQESYFKEHKDEKGQDRYEPK
jgi:ABC-type transporter Mla subunit MlaD